MTPAGYPAGYPTGYTVLPVTGLGEVHEGDDLVALVTTAVDLVDGDVLVVTSKVVSKAEGRVVRGSKEEAVASETARVVARRGGTTIARHRLGLVMAAAGVDASNTEPGTFVLLPQDPDAAARDLREGVAATVGVNVAVLVSDTFGRAWRTGQTDVAIGAAGIEVLDDHGGRTDPYGNDLVVTAPAVADELTGAAELAQGKTTGVPAAVVRGRADLVLPAGHHGPGAAALLRPEEGDMFGLGAREAVGAALLGDRTGFGAAAPAGTLLEAFDGLGHAATGGATAAGEPVVSVALPADPRDAGAAEVRLDALATAHGWRREVGHALGTDTAVFRPATP